MRDFSKNVEARWSDLDPNFHIRHSVYYDWGAYVRMSFLNEHGLTAAVMQELHMGPILFREECIFRRELHFKDSIRVNLLLVKSTRDMGRWTMRHEVWKNGDTLSAIITIDGAWMDTQLRKLAVPPVSFKEVFEQLKQASDFEWIIKS